MWTVSIDGSIGAGKTTVLKRLGRELGIDLFLEPVDEWSECLDRFYLDKDKWSFCLNTKVLCSFAKVPKDRLVLCERSPLSCMKVFAEIGMKDSLESEVLQDVYRVIGWEPSLVIYIKTCPESCMDRIKNRGRSSESMMSLDYLYELDKKYDSLYKKESDFPVVIVDGEKDIEIVYNAVKHAVTTHCLSKKEQRQLA